MQGVPKVTHSSLRSSQDPVAQVSARFQAFAWRVHSGTRPNDKSLHATWISSLHTSRHA